MIRRLRGLLKRLTRPMFFLVGETEDLWAELKPIWDEMDSAEHEVPRVRLEPLDEHAV